MGTKQTPTDLELATLFNQQHGIDEVAEHGVYKMYEATREIIAEAGRKIRDLMPNSKPKKFLIESLADLVEHVESAARGNNNPPSPPTDPVPVAPPQPVVPIPPAVKMPEPVPPVEPVPPPVNAGV